jgi:hypothetical protein
MRITKTADKMTAASYSGTCTFAELDNLSGIRQASLDLLEKMGVTPTKRARTELAGAATRQSVSAQTALSRGIVAQKGGGTTQAFSYYLDAASFGATSTEALNRLSSVTSIIATGSLGDDIRNDIQQRNESIKLIEETKQFFVDHPQYDMVELYYDPSLELEKIDYEDEKASLSFTVGFRVNYEKSNTITKIFDDIERGLESTGRKKAWGIETGFYSYPRWDIGEKKFGIWRGDYGYKTYYPFAFEYAAFFDLLDSNGKVIGTTGNSKLVILGVWKPEDSSKKAVFTVFEGYSVNRKTKNCITHINYNKGNVSWSYLTSGFFVKALDITETLTIRLNNISVFQYQGEKAGTYVNNTKRILQGIDVIPVHAQKLE